MPVGLPKPKRWTQLSKRRSPSLIPIFTEPTFEDWARMSDTRRVTVPRSWASPIVRSATLISGGSSKARVGGDQAVLERAGHGEGLEGGARLVAHGHGAVLARVRGRAADVVGVHARPVGQGEHGAAAGVEHQGGGALGPVGGPHLAQHLLGALLDRRVDGQVEVLARRRALGLHHAHRLAQGVLHQPAAAVLAAQACSSWPYSSPERPSLSMPTLPSTCEASQPWG